MAARVPAMLSSERLRIAGRPQVEYAALDAAILLDLLDAFAASAPPHRHSLAASGLRTETEPELTERGRQAAHVGMICTDPSLDAAGGCQLAAAAGSAPPAQPGGDGEACPPSCQPAEQLAGRLAAARLADAPGSSCTGAPLLQSRPALERPPGDAGTSALGLAGTWAAGQPYSLSVAEVAGPGGVHACLPREMECGGAAPRVSPHEALMRDVACAWGRQLDARSSGAGGRQRVPARRGALGAGKAGSLPAAVPWAPGAAPRFVCDANLEGLARQLRMCGLDATSTPPGGPNKQRFLVHRRAPRCWALLGGQDAPSPGHEQKVGPACVLLH